VLTSLLAYDAAGEVIATLDYVVAKDENGRTVGLIDFSAHEDAGGKLRDVWYVPDAAGSGTWPEWIGGQAHDFRVELNGKRIAALVHKRSGFRRVRSEIQAEVDDRRRLGRPDMRDLLGGPARPLALDESGRVRRVPRLSPSLPTMIVARGNATDGA
jgi:hypothetical protein